MIISHSVNDAMAQIESDSSKTLGLKIGSQNIEPGQFIKVAEAQPTPELSFSVPSSSKTYIIIGLDLDAPFQPVTFLSPILHWIQPGLKASQDETGTSLKSDAPFVTNYIGPSPPPGSGPHRYTFFLYEQPDDFDEKKYAPPKGREMGIYGRVRFDFDKWAKEVGLGDLVAGNYFWSN